ncbi:ankyrin repeat domain-containing protein 26-like [Neovison vison]|uniref:ankyrin repeat domain-containing protein 26-like n=1 Tax=Neovison vison TaxID=452646 RepID=UPI001CEFD534|nr:ankyrin repeat domain-containing protein 26-like [Neogale vison]
MKNTSKPNLRKLMNASQLFKNLEIELGLVSPGDKTLFEDDHSENKCEDTVGVPSKPSVDICDSSPPALPSPDSILKPPFTLLGLGPSKEGEERPEVGTKDHGITESVPQAQTANDCLTSADRAEDDRHVMLSALRFSEQNEESPWDSESNLESLPDTYLDPLSGNADQKGASTLNEKVEASPGKYSYVKPAVEGKYCIPNRPREMEEIKESQSESPGEYSLLKPPVEEKHSGPKKGGEMEETQTSKSASPGKYSYVKPAVEGKYCIPNRPREMEEIKESQSASPGKYSYVKPAVEGKYCIPNRPREMEEIKESQSESPGEYSLLKPPVEEKHSGPKKGGEMEETQISKSDFSAELDLGMTTEKEEESFNESENKHLQIEETEKHQNDEVAVLESIYSSSAAGLMHPKGSGKTGNNLCPITENEESNGDPALDIKKGRAKDKGKQTSKESVITSRFEKAPCLTSCPLQMNNDSTSSGTDQDEGRSSKKTSSDKEEVKKQIDSMDDFGVLTLSSETILEGFHMPDSNHMICMSLIEQHAMDCKDSVSLLKIQHAVLSYERLIELIKYHCGQLKRKNKKMENMAKGLQKELSETKEMISKLELQKVEWEHELCSLRLTLKQEKQKRRNAEMLYEKIQEQLTKREEQYKKEVEIKQELDFKLRALDAELRNVRNNFNQVVEERYYTEKQLCREQDARILQDGILKNHLCKQEEIEVAVRQLQEELANTLKKPSMSEASLEVTSRCRMNLEDEVKDLKEKLAQSMNQVDDLTAKLETMSSRNQVLIQELSSMKEIQMKCEKLEKNKKKLEQQEVNLRSCVEGNVTQVAFQESVAQLRENNNASVRSQMELRIKELEFELSKMKSFQDVTKTELDIYKHLYLEEVTHRMSLTNELNKTSERLAETSTKLLVEKQQKQTLLDTINMRPALHLPYGRNVNNSSLFNRNVALRENVVVPTSNSWRSSNDIETFLFKRQQELEKNITRELEEGAAEFESGSSGGTTYLESTFESHINCDDVLKSHREYSEFLKKKYSI